METAGLIKNVYTNMTLCLPNANIMKDAVTFLGVYLAIRKYVDSKEDVKMECFVSMFTWTRLF